MRHRMTALATILLTTACSSSQAPAPRDAASTSPGTNVAERPLVAEAPARDEGSEDAPSAVAEVAPPPASEAARDGAHADERHDARAKSAPAATSPDALAAPAKGARARLAAEGGPALGGGRGAVMARSESSVRAGEWDDNANYREFQRYLTTVSHTGIEALDLSHRRFLVVRDANGKGVPNCRVVVRDDAQHEASLTTTASGRALLFPRSLGLVGNSLSATANCLATPVVSRFDASADDGVVELRSSATRPALARTIDLVFVLDTTGSMSEEIEAVKDTIQKVASQVGKSQTTVRVALVEYRDKGDSFVTRVYPFSTNLAAFGRTIAALRAGGGGDMPEHANEGLRVAVDDLDWNANADARLAFMIADAPPHLDYQDDVGYGRSVKRAASRGIQLYTVAASGMDDLGQAVWRQTAQYTGATNLFVLRGGAGPQSTGGGDPKSSCGGTQANYTSGNLDQLIVAKIELTEKLLDLDPSRIAGLDRDENAKPCDQRIVLAR